MHNIATTLEWSSFVGTKEHILKLFTTFLIMSKVKVLKD
jgi:hypothetical protein